jgi:SAM-dependent methyltransferase
VVPAGDNDTVFCSGGTLERFLALCPPGAMILDAACGTGKYWPLIRESGRHVLGTDQSSGMLAQARAKLPDVPIAKIALQDLPWTEVYPGVNGEFALEGGYHYYPTLPQVQEWVIAARLVTLDTSEGDGYSHWLTQKLP